MPLEYVRSGSPMKSRTPENLDDRIELLVGFTLGHAHQRRVEPHVLRSSEVGMEARSEFEQSGNPAVHLDGARGRLRQPGRQPEQGALARPVRSDYCQPFARQHLKRDIAQSAEGNRGLQRSREQPFHMLLDQSLARVPRKGLRHVAEGNGDHR